MTRALDGIRVIDLTVWFQGPVAAQYLADFGADVIKVERPQGGDQARGVRSIKSLEIGDWNQYFLVINRNKKSMALDLKTEGGREIMYRLVAESDDRIVGFALGTTVTKSHSAWKYGYLVWLGIDPDFHAQGIASRLFTRFRDLMLEDGVRMLLVDTEADNLPALHFFRKMGFGHAQEHIYLALNLDPQLRQYRGKRLNGRSGSRYRVNGDD